MQVRVSRDSVCAGDDLVAHEDVVEVPSDGGVQSLVASVLAAYSLPLISGGRATWCVAAAVPLAVIAQERPEPRFLWAASRSLRDCGLEGPRSALHFSYFAQMDPEAVYAVLSRLTLKCNA